MICKKIYTPLNSEIIDSLQAGDCISLTGNIYAARDAAHKKMYEMILKGQELPFDIINQVIYYVGPCPAKPGEVIGSAGPTTSGRMDYYTPKLLEAGLRGMIGKGQRSREVIESMIINRAVYFGAVGGAGALIAKCIKQQEIIAFPELGPEALRRMYVEDFPLTVIIDSRGKNIYEEGIKQFKIK